MDQNAQPLVPRQRGPVEDDVPTGARTAAAWPAADRFAVRSGLTTTQARLLLAAFCGVPPDHTGTDRRAGH